MSNQTKAHVFYHNHSILCYTFCMRWIFPAICITLILLVIGLLRLINNSQPASIVSTPTPTPKSSETNKQSVVIDIEELPMRISWVKVDPKNLDLYSNLQEKLTSTIIRAQKNCQVLVNAGFYSKENKHLGLLISNYEIFSKTLSSSLFNGFFSVDENGANINTSPPANSSRLAIQSGPILLYNNDARIITISNNDEPARRIVAATTSDTQVLFLAIHRDGSELQGPYLTQVPNILSSFENETGININNAINLDGGSASVFITDSVYLPEVTQIGSYFCAK